MSTVLVAKDVDLVPEEFADLLKPVLAKWETAILRVAAAHADKTRFVVPPGKNTPEGLLARRFAQFPVAKRNMLGERAVRALGSPKTKERLGTHVSLRSLADARPVDDRMVAAPPMAMTQTRATEIAIRTLAETTGVRRFGSDALFGSGTLRMDLIRVVCIDETDGLFWPFNTEAGQDEIYLMGTILDGSTNVGEIPPFKVGEFDDGTRKDYSPAKQLLKIDLNSSTEFPKAYFVSLILVEKDQGDLNETLSKIIQKLADESAAWLAAAIAGYVGAAAGGPIAAAIAASVAWAVTKLVELLKAAWDDDLFTAVTLNVLIPDSQATLDPNSQVFHARGPGEYALRYQWKFLKGRPKVTTGAGTQVVVHA